MSFFLVGINNRSAPLEVRERFFVASKDLEETLASVRRHWPLKGAVILSTCNRVEVYCEADNSIHLKDLLGFLASRPLLEKYETYEKEGRSAVEHLFSVASGLESDIVGEKEILGQVRQAYLIARQAGATSPFVNAVFERAIFAGKLARRKFDLFQEGPSIAGAAVENARVLSAGLEGKNIFILGAGLVAAALAKECALNGASCVFVANRTIARAKELAARFDAAALRFDEFYDRLDEADIIFCATASKHFVLKKDIFQGNRHTEKGVIIFDLALPRDVEPDIRGLRGVRLFDLDQISSGDNYSRPVTDEIRALIASKAEYFFKRYLWRSGSEYGQARWQESRPLRPCLS